MYARLIILAMVAIVASAATQQTARPNSALRRTELLKTSLSVPDREIIQVRVDFEPGVSSIRHRHPGEEVAFVLAGTIEYRLGVEAPVTVGPGETLFIPDGVAHTARNVGQGPASELATYVVRKGAVLVEPAQ
jgi:quercetin dioxygenase-like cupin family protein